MSKIKNSGQALIMVMLSVAVVMSVAVSLATRTTTDTATARKEEESLRAFSAAEAGVEQVLQERLTTVAQSSSTPVPQQVTGALPGTNVSTTVGAFPSNPRQYVYPAELVSGDSGVVWFTSFDSNGNPTCASGVPCYSGNTLRLCFGNRGNAQPAISVRVAYNEAGTIRMVTGSFDPEVSRRNGNGFSGSGVTSNASGNVCSITSQSGTSTQFGSFVDLNMTSLGVPASAVSSNNLRFMIVRLLYNSTATTFGITNLPDDLPSQGRVVDSQGTSGEAVRRVQVYSLYPEIPSIFTSSIYSPQGITK